jgi:L-rhamnose mutarotase
MEATEVDARRQAEMAPLFESGSAPVLARLEEVFHLD